MKDFERVYGKGVAYTKAGIELVSMDIDAVGKVVKPALKSFTGEGTDSSAALKGYREVFFPEVTNGFVQTAIYEYDRLRPGNVIEGPAIVESPTNTIVIPPEKSATLDAFLQLVIGL